MVEPTPVVLQVPVTGPPDLAPLVARLADEHPGRRFAVVLTTRHASWLAALTAALAPYAAEWVFADAPDASAGSGSDLALRALDEHGLGQDFVFTVADLAEAVRYAVAQLEVAGAPGWEADAVLVLD